MRCCITPFAILLALIAFSPTQTMAKDPGGGGRGRGEGGNQSEGVHVNNGEQHGDHQIGVNPHINVGADERINVGVRSNVGVLRGQEIPHQVFDARNRPEFSGGREGRDSWRYRWDNDRWWFYGPDNRWMWYGNDGRWLPYGNVRVVLRPVSENFSGGLIKIVNPAKNGVTLSYTLDGNVFTIQPGYSQELREDHAWVIEFSRGANLDQTRYGLQSGVYTFAPTDHGWELYRSEFPQAFVPQPPVAAPTNPSPQ